MKILLCDKEPIIFKLLAKELTQHGLDVITAENGYKGMEMVREHKPEIVLTDLLLPLVNGLEYISIIRDESPNTSVIVYSEISEENMIEQIYRLGAKDFISKPFDPERIIGRIKRLDVYQTNTIAK